MSFVRRGLFFALFASAVYGQPTFRPEIPKVWDDAALAEWATPVAGLNLRPKHISASEYYALKIENLRTYPVYAPGREPEGIGGVAARAPCLDRSRHESMHR